MIDPRPGVPAAERYKALAGTARTGLHAFASEDGLRWRRLGDGAVLTKGAFDSQNVPSWSEHEGRYLCYSPRLRRRHPADRPRRPRRTSSTGRSRS